MAKSNRPDKIFQVIITPSKVPQSSPVRVEEIRIFNASMNETTISKNVKRRKSIPENAAENSKESISPYQENLVKTLEEKSDNVESDEEGKVQSPKQDVRSK
jgi:hypothetical protein